MFGVEGGAAGQEGNRQDGHRPQGPPGPLCPPQRGHMARLPLTDPHSVGRAQPAALQPHAQMEAARWRPEEEEEEPETAIDVTT